MNQQLQEIFSSQTQRFRIDGPCFSKADICESILRSLPAWFGIQEVIVQHEAEIDRLPTILECRVGEVMGF
jgi:hypothetical protein